MIEEPKQYESAGNEKKSPLGRFFLILSLALPVVILAAGILILTTPALLPDKPAFVRLSVGGLFVAYALYRMYQVYARSQRES